MIMMACRIVSVDVHADIRLIPNLIPRAGDKRKVFGNGNEFVRPRLAHQYQCHGHFSSSKELVGSGATIYGEYSNVNMSTMIDSQYLLEHYLARNRFMRGEYA